MTRDEFLHWAKTKLLPSVAAPGAPVKSGAYWRSVIVKTGVGLAVDALETSPFTMRVHLVTYDDREKKRWKAWDAAIGAGKPLVGVGPYPGGLIPHYVGRAKEKAFFRYEWVHQGPDYVADAVLAEERARWLRRLYP